MTDVVDRRTARVHLRSLTTADAPVVAALQSDPRTNAHRPGGPPSREREQAVHEFVRGWQEDGIGYWSLSSIEGCRRRGVRPLQFRGRTCWNLYYRLAPEVWAWGSRSRPHARQSPSRRPYTPTGLRSRTRPANGPAVRVAEGAGLTQRSDLDAGGFVVPGSPRSTADRSTTGRRTRCVWHRACGDLRPGNSPGGFVGVQR